jgi:hypothetical protein
MAAAAAAAVFILIRGAPDGFVQLRATADAIALLPPLLLLLPVPLPLLLLLLLLLYPQRSP